MIWHHYTSLNFFVAITRNGQNISGVMVGHYRIVDDKIIGVMKAPKSASSTNNNAPRFGKRRRNSLFTYHVPEQEFHYVSEK